MDTKTRFVSFLGMAGLCVLFGAFVLTLAGLIDWRIVDDREFPAWVEFAGNFFLFMVNIFIVFKKSIGEGFIKAVLLYLPVYVVSFPVFGASILSTWVLPGVLAFAFCKLSNKSVCTFSAKYIIFGVLMGAYQWVSGFVKVGLLRFDYNSVGLFGTFLFSIDLIVFLIFVERRVDFDAIISFFMGLAWKHVIPTKTQRVQQVPEPRKESLDTTGLTTRQRCVFLCLVYGFQIFQLAVVMAIGTLNNMTLEMLVMLPVFWMGRKILGNSYHSDKLWVCSAVSFASFYVLTKVSPSFQTSLFCAIALVGIFTYGMHVLGERGDRLELLENKYNNDYTRFGLRPESANFAYDWKVAGLSDKDLMDKYKLSGKNTLNSRKRFVDKKINTK